MSSFRESSSSWYMSAYMIQLYGAVDCDVVRYIGCRQQKRCYAISTILTGDPAFFPVTCYMTPVLHVHLHIELPHQLLCSLLHNIKHIPDAVTLLEAVLVTFEFISEVFDNQPF